MRKLFTLLAAVLLAANLWAQSPEKMSYQAIIRDADDNLISDTQVGMQISILQGSANGSAVYVETQTPTTNANGLISLEIGTGTTSDDFSSIDWANGPYFIKTETDPAGGTSYSITGTSQLLSVPYALHAQTAETVTGDISETDPVYSGSEAANIDATDITNLDNLSGVNTGDQDLSALATETALGDSTALVRSEIPDVSGFLTSESDPTYTSSQAANIDATDITNLGNLSGTNTGDQDLSTLALKTNVLELDNTTAFTPNADYEPATKKYVDDNAGSGSTTYSVGDFAQGGIVFWVDETGQHGLVAAKVDQDGGSGIQWYNGSNTDTEAHGDGVYAGEMNTMLIIANQGSNSNDYAAGVCANYTVTESGVVYGDWYLPSKEELDLMYQNKATIEATAGANGGSGFADDYYWSSTEYSSNLAWPHCFEYGFQSKYYKNDARRVRAVRAF
jgi:hypothetical protein